MDSRVQASQFGKMQILVVLSRETQQFTVPRTERKGQAFIEMNHTLLLEQFGKVAMPSVVNHGIDSKYPESSKIWDSFSERHTLFWTNSPSEEERLFRFARIGFLLSAILLSLLGTAEFLFVMSLLWQIVR